MHNQFQARESALNRWGKAMDGAQHRDPLQNFRWARWTLPELDEFRNEVGKLTWPGSYGATPWQFTFSVACSLFTQRHLPLLDPSWQRGMSLDLVKAEIAACRDLCADLPPHPDQGSVAIKSLRCRTLKNPGYDCEYPPEKFPFVVMIEEPGNPLANKWMFARSDGEAVLQSIEITTACQEAEGVAMGGNTV